MKALQIRLRRWDDTQGYRPITHFSHYCKTNNIGVPRILQWRGFTWWGPGKQVWGPQSLRAVQVQSPGRRSGGRSAQKLKQNMKLV